jgi:hypothetical protein
VGEGGGERDGVLPEGSDGESGWGKKISSQISSWSTWASGDPESGDGSDHPSLSSDDISWLDVKEAKKDDSDLLASLEGNASSWHSKVMISRHTCQSCPYFFQDSIQIKSFLFPLISLTLVLCFWILFSC